MTDHDVTLYLDAVDPLSFLMDLEVLEAERLFGLQVQRALFELRPAPAALTDPDDPFWAPRWTEAEAQRSAKEGSDGLVRPGLVPNSRKAHELIVHAGESGLADEARLAITEAFFLSGKDIGRIDVLVEIGSALGLDFTETKAVLDVDRYEQEVAGLTEAASVAGVTTVPCLVAPHARLEGFHNQAALGTLLAGQ